MPDYPHPTAIEAYLIHDALAEIRFDRRQRIPFTFKQVLVSAHTYLHPLAMHHLRTTR